MQSPIVSAQFDAITREGCEVVVSVAIGDPYDLPTKDGPPDVGFYIEVEPLMERTHQGGTDTLMAMCFSIQLVRKALTVFVAHGGSLFMRGSRYPIDLQSPWFEAIGGMLHAEHLAPESSRNQDGG